MVVDKANLVIGSRCSGEAGIELGQIRGGRPRATLKRTVDVKIKEAGKSWREVKYLERPSADAISQKPYVSSRSDRKLDKI